jgi:cytochrome c peroxidase
MVPTAHASGAAGVPLPLSLKRLKEPTMKWNLDSRHLAGAATCAVLLQLTVIGCRSAGDGASNGDRQDTLTRIPDPPEDEPLNSLRSLKGLKPAEPKDLDKFVRNRDSAILLGKALFWDVQAGSDGQACASCHAHAGADHRKKNQLSPGLNNQAGPPKSETFDPTGSGQPGGPNYTLVAADYPFHRLADVNDRESAVKFDTDDTASSQGVFKRTFVSTVEDPDGRETCTDVPDIFNIAGQNIRRVEPRNTPTTINSAFFPRLFWDGRANNIFNGVNPFGPRDPNAKILERASDGTTLNEVRIRLENAALASQAVGPILSGFEMSCEGRTLPDVGKKLRPRRALALQDVAWDDSVLGARRHPSGKGLDATYEQLIQDAFEPKYWGTSTSSTVITDGTVFPVVSTQLDPAQLEHNFGLFWGLSIMLYEATLVSDDAPIDRYLNGYKSALTPEQVFGKAIFEGPAKCINCHHGPVMSGAAFAFAAEKHEANPFERMPMGDGRVALYDNGFYNIGVRPTVEDIGAGGVDPFGNPLALSRIAKIAAGGGAVPAGELTFDNQFFAINRGQDPRANERDAVDGSFKTPTLRNVELTGPYFHNGGQATLEQVIDFYNRGGDRRGGQLHVIDGEQIVTGSDTTGFGPNDTNLDPDIQRLGLGPQAKKALVAFLLSFTDDRVRFERAPFDHPSISLPNGATPPNLDDRIAVPAVGAGGRGPLGLGPLKPFLHD